MSKSDRLSGKLVDRTQIARIIFAAAESMGISDRNHIEKLTSQVIERLECSQMLPGMEHLAPRNYKQKHIASEFEILSAVKEFLAEDSAEEKVEEVVEIVEEIVEERQQVIEKEEPVMADKAKVDAGIDLTENALHVLQRRYLKKDKQGNAVETPQEMFRRRCSAVWHGRLPRLRKYMTPKWTQRCGSKSSIV